MPGPDPAVAAIRGAVREAVTDLEAGSLVLAACSGGADSLALAAALAFVAPRAGLRAGGVTIDHGLQAGSDERADQVVAKLRALGLDPVLARRVVVTRDGGLEAAARDARYAALSDIATSTGAAAVLLGHTLDDQAETVLLGLARGSGARSLAGMPPVRGLYRRPLLGIRRAVTARAAADLEPWQDPHNADRRFARVRVRLDALPALEAALGPGVAEALARTATQLRADNQVLDNLAKDVDRQMTVAMLAAQPAAIRSRLLRDAAVAAGCPPGALTATHVGWLSALVTDWHGQRWVDLPGGVRALRGNGEVLFMEQKGRDGRARHGTGAQGSADLRRDAADSDS
jgi:tRNA(Ile)-lysidine synthase